MLKRRRNRLITSGTHAPGRWANMAGKFLAGKGAPLVVVGSYHMTFSGNLDRTKPIARQVCRRKNNCFFFFVKHENNCHILVIIKYMAIINRNRNV